MPIDKSVKTCSVELKKIDNNNRYEGFINYEEEKEKDEEEKEESDDKKVACKKNINESKNAIIMKQTTWRLKIK